MTRHCPTAGECPGQQPAPPPTGLTPIHGDGFSANPHATYAALRAHASIMPVEIAPGVAGYLTLTYRAALYLLRNPARFAKDPRHWAAWRRGQVPSDSPALEMMKPRDNALWMDGAEHARLRRAITFSLERVDTYALMRNVARIADTLIDQFIGSGVTDLVGSYANPLPMLTMIEMFGCPADLTQRIVGAIARLFDGDEPVAANAEVEAACLELTHLKRAHPGEDVTSWLISQGLNDREMVSTIILVVGAASTPSSNLIMNGSRLIITDERFADTVHTGVQLVSEALDEVLWTDPPVSNYSPLYAQGPQRYEGVVLEPGYPILVSFAAANSDPLVAPEPGQLAGNRGHLAFSAGPHGCPAPGLARIISETALERVVARLPGLELAIPEQDLRNRPGPFTAGLTALPVRFRVNNESTLSGRQTP